MKNVYNLVYKLILVYKEIDFTLFLYFKSGREENGLNIIFLLERKNKV